MGVGHKEGQRDIVTGTDTANNCQKNELPTQQFVEEPKQTLKC